MVVRKVVEVLDWTPGDPCRAIFIAGNEPFTQGPVDYRQGCRQAVERGIVVNTIHRGSEADGRRRAWEGRRGWLMGGSSTSIRRRGSRKWMPRWTGRSPS